MADNKINFYDVLKEMDSVDPKSVLAGIDLIEAKQGKKGTVVSMGIGIDAVKDILSGKTIPVLLMMDSAAYESAKGKVTMQQMKRKGNAEIYDAISSYPVDGMTFPDKKPGQNELSVDVLVVEGGEWVIGYYDFTGGEWVDNVNGTPIFNPTKWCYLPGYKRDSNSER